MESTTTSLSEITEIVDYSKDLILLLDTYRGFIDPVADLQRTLTQIEKTFIKIDLKINENDTCLDLTRDFLMETNSCLSGLKETLVNIHRIVNQLDVHNDNTNSFMNTIWNILNQGQIYSSLRLYTKEVKNYCEHLAVNYLPIMNSVITNSFERTKIRTHVRTLSQHDKEKIRFLLMMDNNIMRLYLPKEDSLSFENENSRKRRMAMEAAAAAARQHSATEPETAGRETFVGEGEGLEGGGGTTTATPLLSEENAEKQTTRSALYKRRLSRGSIATAYDVVHDYYHVKWLHVLPKIWKDSYPDLTLGQIKYIYLTNPFFLEYCNDPYFINSQILRECASLQLYLQSVEELPLFKEEDYCWVASLIHDSQGMITMRELIDQVNERFAGKRSFTYQLLIASELFAVHSPIFEKILRESIDEFPLEEAKWPVGEVDIHWTVLHVIQRKHNLIFS